MKADEMKIFRLEDRILFEAAAAAEVVDAVQNDPGVNNTADAEDKKSNEIEAVLNAPVENGNTTAGTVVDPADTADIDAQLNALIEGVIPQEAQNDPVAVQLHDNGLTVSTGKELVVIDDSVKDIDSILAELSPDQDILILEKDNGLDELNDYLDSQDTVYSAIHFVTHGSKGEISINGDFISSENFDSSEWSKIGEHLTADGDLLFYGCEIAESEDGQTLLEQISAASDADVAASIDRTGLSGNWDLEYTIGDVTTTNLSVSNYTGDLTDISVDNYTELSNALTEAATNGGKYTITITDNIDFSGQNEIWINFYEATELTIKSDGKVITGTDGFGIFSFDNTDYAVSVSIENIIFTDSGSGSGDAEECAVHAKNLFLTIKNSEFNNFDGRAVIFSSSDDTHQLKIEHSSFSNNFTPDNGGAISVDGASQVTISNSYFNGNEAEKGGAVSLEAVSATITNTTFYNNNAENGGAVYMETGTLDISNSTFYQNSATDNGGAISMFDTNAGNSSITDTTFAANTAGEDGGAVYMETGTLDISNGTFYQNSATDNGGAISVNGASQVTISNSYFNENKALNGGGGAVSLETVDSSTITNTTFYNNNADDGGAVYMETRTLDISNSTFYQNTAQSGGAVSLHYHGTGSATITDTTFAANALSGNTGSGSAVFNADGSLTITNTLLIGAGDSVLHQEPGGSVNASYSLITSISGATAGITLGTNTEVSADFTQDKVFGNNTYDADDKHTITPDAFHKAAWCGTAETGAKDQNDEFRSLINDTLGLTGKFTVGAVTAKAGIIVTQNNATVTYTGNIITPDKTDVTFKYADATDISKTLASIGDPVSNPPEIRNPGDYTLTPQNAVFSGVDADDISIKYVSGTLHVDVKFTINVEGTKVYDGTSGKGASSFTYTYTDPTGKFEESWITIEDFTYNSKNVEGTKAATGTAKLTDAAALKNYDITWNFSGSISQLGIVVGGITAEDRFYDGTKDVQLNTSNATFTNMIAGDSLTVTNTTGTMTNKNAGDGKSVDLGTLVLDGADAQNYFVAQDSQTTTTVNIAKANLTITVDDQADITYGTAVAPTYTSTVLAPGDTITGELAITGDKSTSGNWIVGTHDITQGTLTVDDGNNGNNYELQFNEDSFTVNKLGVTVGGITADNRDYDGTKDVQLNTSNATFTTMIAGDSLTVTNTTGTMTNKNAGDNKSVDLGTLDLGGADAQNYFVAQGSQSSTSVNIGKATLVITVADQADVTYGTGVSPTYSSNGLIANDTITGELAISGKKSTSGNWIVGTHDITQGTLTVDDGNNGNNYELQFNGDSFTVNKLGVTVGGITAVDRDYDGTKDVQLNTSNATFTNMILGDDLTVTNTTGTMDDKNAGVNKKVTLGELVLGGADAQNYFVNDNSQSHTNVNISKATLSLNVTVPDSKTYDGTVSVDAKVSADGIIQGDDVVLDLKWEYNSPNVAEADKITNVQYELSGAQAGNYQLPQDIPYRSVDGSITAKDVQVDFVTDAPYIFDGTDQSDSVSATITDVNGNKIDLVIDWNGKTFVEAGSYTVTAELRPADPNYKLVNNTLTLEMFAKTDNAFVVYTDGTASIYSATIPALQGSILAAGNADGSIYTMPWGELIAKAMLSYSRHFDGGDHPGMNYGSDHHELTVTVDTLKFRPMETDNIVRDAFEHLNFRETITKPQALYLGKELFIDSNHPESDYVALFEKRSSTYSPGHEPLYVERDYSADENESMTFSSQMATLFLPGSFAKAENSSAAENYDLPIQSSAVAEKAENMKSDLEKLLDELSHVS